MLPSVEVITPPAATPVSYPEAKDHLRLDDDHERGTVVAMIAAATEYAEGQLQRSLIKRTLRATVLADIAAYPYRCVPLPRGPVLDLVSIDGEAAGHGVTVARHGTTYLAQFPGGYEQPDVGGTIITYHAGYGDEPTDVPADLRLAIKMHVAHLYRFREITSDRPQNHVAHGLDAIYARHRAGGPLS